MPDIDHWEALFDRTYLRWFHLHGQPSLCEIVRVDGPTEMTLPGGAKARKPLLHLKQIQGKAENAVGDDGKKLPTLRPLVLNATNACSLKDLYGTKPSGWVGKRIVLLESTTRIWDDATRKMEDVPCIRIREPKETAGG